MLTTDVFSTLLALVVQECSENVNFDFESKARRLREATLYRARSILGESRSWVMLTYVNFCCRRPMDELYEWCYMRVYDACSNAVCRYQSILSSWKRKGINKKKNESDLIVYIASKLNKSPSLSLFSFSDSQMLVPFLDFKEQIWSQVSCSEHVHGSINPRNPGSCTASGDAAPIVPGRGKLQKMDVGNRSWWCIVLN